MSLPQAFLNQNIESSQDNGPRTDKGEPSIPNMAEDAPDPTPEPSGNDSGRASSPQSGNRGPPADDSGGSSKATDVIENITDLIPGSGEKLGPEDVKNILESAEEQFSKDLDSRVNDLESQFTDRIEQTQEGVNSQIDEVVSGLSQVNSNVQDNVNALGEGIANTQSAIGSIPSTISDLFEQQNEGGDDSGGIDTQMLLIGAAAVAAVLFVTQRE